MRIVHGDLSGRRPLLPKSLDARPTTDTARGALFNILLNRYDFESIRALDLFSGSGCISYEFASLGCRDITAVERDRVHCDYIRKNIQILAIPSLRLVQTDVFQFLKKLQAPYDIIFADPPYNHPGLPGLPQLIESSGLCKEDSTFILEHGPSNNFENEQGWLEERTYGTVHFSFFRY